MILFIFPFIAFATTSVVLEIETCADQAGGLQNSVAEGYFRFHGTDGFTGWRKWESPKVPGSAHRAADVDVGVTTHVVIGTSSNATYNWCIQRVLINGQVLINTQNASNGVYLGLNCQNTDGIRPCNGAHRWMVPGMEHIDSDICRSHADCHNEQENGEGYCDMFGNCYSDDWCCYYWDSFDGTCPNQAACETNTHLCESHADCGDYDEDSNTVASHYCTLYNFCEHVEWCCFYQNAVNGLACPNECVPPEQHPVCQEYDNAKPCIPNFIFQYPLTRAECEERCMQYSFCTGIQSHTNHGTWDECALILGDSCDLQEMRHHGGEYTLTSRTCFDPELHDRVAPNYTWYSGTNCVAATESVWKFHDLTEAITSCNFLADCQGIVDKGCDASKFYMCHKDDTIKTNTQSCLFYKDAAGDGPEISMDNDNVHQIQVHSCSTPPDDAVLEIELIGHNGGILLVPLRIDGRAGDHWSTGDFMGDIGTVDRMRLYPSTMERFCIDDLLVNGETWNSTFGTPQLWLSSDCTAYRLFQCSELQYLESIYIIYTCVTINAFEIDDLLAQSVIQNSGQTKVYVKLSVHTDDVYYFPVDTNSVQLIQGPMTVGDQFCWAGEITDYAFEIFAVMRDSASDRLLSTGTYQTVRSPLEAEDVRHGPRSIPLSSGHGDPKSISISWSYTRIPPSDAIEAAQNMLHRAHCNGTQALAEFNCATFVSDIAHNARACLTYRISPGAQCTLGGCYNVEYENRDIICMESSVWHLEFSPTSAPTAGYAYRKISGDQCEQVSVKSSCGDVSGLESLGFQLGSCGWSKICPSQQRTVYVSDMCGSYPTTVFQSDCSNCYGGCIASDYPVTLVENDSESFSEQYPWVFPIVISTLVICICVVVYMIWIQRRKKHAVRNLKTQENIRRFSQRQRSFVDEPQYFEDSAQINFPNLPANALAVNHYEVGDVVQISIKSQWKKATVIAVEKMRVQCKIDGTSNIHWMDVGSDKLRNVPLQLSRPVVSTAISGSPQYLPVSSLESGASGSAQPWKSDDEHADIRKALNWKDDQVVRIKFESILVDQGIRLQDHEFQLIFSFLSGINGMLSWSAFSKFLYAEKGKPFNPEEHPKLTELRDQIRYVLNSKSDIIDVSDTLSQIETPNLPIETIGTDSKIQLNVNMIESNTTISVEASPEESVKTVLGRIRRLSAVPELEYELSHQGSKLDPNAPLSLYNLQSDSQVTARVQISEENHI